jgi:hypothetical protein
MRRAALTIALLLLGSATSVRLSAEPAQPQPAPSSGTRCLTDARDRAIKAFEQGAAREAARRQLETDAASCLDPRLTRDAAHLVGTVNADRARFARDFLAGKLTLTAYRAALQDRADKLARLLADPAQQRELVEGDADGDLVPDRRDACPGTPDGAPTDARGCPIRPPEHPEAGSDELLRATLSGARFLFNKSCDGAPTPLIPSPLAWGRGRQLNLGTQGFNIAVSKVSGQPAGCELFYEIQFRFFDPAPFGGPGPGPAVPPAEWVTVVFSNSEDLQIDPARAIFPLPLGRPLSPGRTKAREAMVRLYLRATWRVRAVNGANVESQWSPFVTQSVALQGVGTQ